MAVRGHVRGDEAPLGESLSLEVAEELREVLLVRKATGAGVGVVQDCIGEIRDFCWDESMVVNVPGGLCFLT